jgi:uncharacterized membrane protein YeiH
MRTGIYGGIVDDHTIGSVSATMTARLYATIHEPPISGS